MTLPPVDLRSDTVTRPTEAMREAMARAPVGDDALGEDPTVRQLEERIAALLGQEAGLFVPSGIMGNQLAIGVLARPGEEVLLEERAHILHWEEGAPAALWGVQLRALAGNALGCPDPEAVRAQVRGESPFLLRTAALAFENTHMGGSGSVIPPEDMAAAARPAREVGAAIHLDGARLWNAAAASSLPPSAWGAQADTVMVSLSKGLGCPVGAVLASSTPRIREARRLRRRLGGQMRQVGVLAAAGLHALDHHRERLTEDHRRAAELAAGLRALPGLRVPEPSTNVVLVEVEPWAGSPTEVAEFLKGDGVLVLPFGGRMLRAVTHLDVQDEGIRRALGSFGRWASAHLASA